MLKRIVSALLALPLLFFIIIKNGFFVKFFIPIFAIIALYEFFNAFRHIGIEASKIIGFISILMMFVMTLKKITAESILLWLAFTMFCILISNLLKKEFDAVASGITALGIYYIVFFAYHILFILNSSYPQLVWLVFITAWATDTCAYFTGSFIGKRKLCPQISPKKTIEGSIGGIIGSVIISLIFAYFIVPHIFIHCIWIGFIGSIMGQVGDLTASIFKRYTGIKDYGKIMPGHGGILDRFDSILFTAPTVYYYMIFLLK